ncbi:MAG: hypothetical protein ABI460_12355 [Caldimonas sp.]
MRRRLADGASSNFYALRFDNFTEEKIMGKYVLGWFLGVPVIVLVAIYFFMH